MQSSHGWCSSPFRTFELCSDRSPSPELADWDSDEGSQDSAAGEEDPVAGISLDEMRGNVGELVRRPVPVASLLTNLEQRVLVRRAD